MALSIGLLGIGRATPAHVRRGTDPIFDDLRANAGEGAQGLFDEIAERRVLGLHEDVVGLTVQAIRSAMDDCGSTPADIDRLYGTILPSEYILPNCLFRAHAASGFSRDCAVVPVDTGFTGFLKGCLLAWEAALSGRARRSVVACGSGLSRHVDPRSRAALVVGDGAGAAVVGETDRLVFVDYAERTYTADDDYHGMTLAPRITERHGVRTVHVDSAGLPVPTFEIDERGARSFAARGLREPPLIARELLERNGARPADVTLISHQGSKRLVETWVAALEPRAHLDTVDRYGDITVASIPVTLSERRDEIRTPWVLFVAPSPGAHFSAMLLRN